MAHNFESRAFYAPTCSCLERGYVVKGGQFQACDCEAGQEWAKAHQAPAVTVEAPELAPVIAGPAKVVPMVKVRRSARFDGLTYESRRQGETMEIVFRYGKAFSAYVVNAAGARLVDCSDRYSLPHLINHCCLRFAQDVAAKMKRKAA